MLTQHHIDDNGLAIAFLLFAEQFTQPNVFDIHLTYQTNITKMQLYLFVMILLLNHCKKCSTFTIFIVNHSISTAMTTPSYAAIILKLFSMSIFMQLNKSRTSYMYPCV